MGIVIYDGVSSADFGIQVEHRPGYSFAERDYEATHVPGRNGDIIFSTNSYKNVTRSYELAIGHDQRMKGPSYSEMANMLVSWLHPEGKHIYDGNSNINSQVGYLETVGLRRNNYFKLEDSYEPGFYRWACLHDAGDISNIYNSGGKLTVEFDCMPQRYYKDADRPRDLIYKDNAGQYANVTIHNPTNFVAKPIILVYKSDDNDSVDNDSTTNNADWELRINDDIIHCHGNYSGWMVIDCESMEIYKRFTTTQTTFSSLSSICSLYDASGTTGDFFSLYPGDNLVTFSNDNIATPNPIIIPRFWTL